MAHKLTELAAGSPERLWRGLCAPEQRQQREHCARRRRESAQISQMKPHSRGVSAGRCATPRGSSGRHAPLLLCKRGRFTREPTLEWEPKRLPLGLCAFDGASCVCVCVRSSGFSASKACQKGLRSPGRRESRQPSLSASPSQLASQDHDRCCLPAKGRRSAKAV